MLKRGGVYLMRPCSVMVTFPSRRLTVTVDCCRLPVVEGPQGEHDIVNRNEAPLLATAATNAGPSPLATVNRQPSACYASAPKSTRGQLMALFTTKDTPPPKVPSRVDAMPQVNGTFIGSNVTIEGTMTGSEPVTI